MKTYTSINDFSSSKKSIVTIGTFDGVHIGHRKILEKVIQNAIVEDCESVVLTFFPHPRMILQAENEIKLLNTLEEKVMLLEKAGIDHVIIHPFSQEFSRLTAEEFVKTILVDRLNIQKIIIGHDHRFGRNRTANIDDLIQFGEKYNFDVEQISAQEIDEIAISSTKIRNALTEGDMGLANNYLGYKYFFSGIVTAGKQLGRTIGFPTANIQLDENYKLIPKNGVYVVKSTYNHKIIFGMMNIGNRPTVNGENQTIEINFFDFDENLYDKKLTITLLERIRNEEKFSSLEMLKLQLNNDKVASLGIISKINNM